MIDDSKHTDDIDISHTLDDGDPHATQDSNRNLHLKRVSMLSNQNDVSTDQAIDLRKTNTNKILLEDEDDPTLQSNTSSKVEGKRAGQGSGTKVYMATEEAEEQKTQDFISPNDLYDADSDEQRNQRRFNTAGNEVKSNDEESKTSQTKQTQPSRAKFATFSMKHHLPQLKINVPLAITGNDIFEIFTGICKAQRFQVIEMDQNIATAVNKEPFSFKKILQRCIPFASSEARRDQPNESQISAVRLQITVNEVKGCRKVGLKGLYGESHRLQEFLTQFKNKLHEQVQQLPQDKRKMINNQESNQSGETPKNRIDTKSSGGFKGAARAKILAQDDDDSDGEQNNGGYNETSAIYQIHKILSSDQYTLGKNVAQYIECFHLQYKSLRESAALLPQPMEGIMGLIHETVQSFHSEYNLGKETAKSLMHFCRPSVEKYVFSKLYDKLFSMYAIKNEDEDRLFIERSSLIKRLRSHDIMHYLGIKQAFIIGDNQAHSMRFEDHLKDNASVNYNYYDSHRSDSNLNLGINPYHHQSNHSVPHENLFNNTSTSSNLGAMLNSGRSEHLPYIEAIRCIEKIQQFQSPREKLQCISESYGCLKTAIVDHWKGKMELNTMDDVLPLSIYVVSMAELTHPASELNIMEDYLSLYDKGFDFERKLLTNFDVSIRYINHEWEIQNNQ